MVPVSHGPWTLTEETPDPIWTLAPYPGQADVLSTALLRAGLDWPSPGMAVSTDDGRVLWSGRDQAFLLGREPEPDWAAHTALTDVSDAWCVLRLHGVGAEEVLARLVPVDLRMKAFPNNAVARTLCGHMTVLVTRYGPAFEIYAFRSMAGTLVHELETAMAALAARRAGR
nr:sarcosine oxidase subunit gamma [Cognatishimia sp. F0-27]